MSQTIWSTINAETTSGTMLASILTDFKDAIMSGFAGTSRPSQLTAGGMWIDISNQSAPNYYWSFKVWTGDEDIEVFRLNINTGFGGPLIAEALFEVQNISADTVAAIKKLIKSRPTGINNGQVNSGDTVGEIQFIGRTVTSTNPTVAYIKWVATDDETATEFGGTFSFYTTPNASNTIAEHMKFIDGIVEMVKPLKVTAGLQLVSQNVPTASSIVQLSGATAVAEFTGVTATQVQGINSGEESKVVTLHNRSTANVTLKHENGSAAEEDRLQLPNSDDYVIEPENSISLIYNATDERWKIMSSGILALTTRSETITGIHGQWTSPADVNSRINVTVYRKKPQQRFQAQDSDENTYLRTKYGKLYSWGVQNGGNLGDGTSGAANSKSSPVAVIGGFNFPYISEDYQEDVTAGTANSLFGIATDGVTYAWGLNSAGRLGTGDRVARSSPVAVVGGFKFKRIFNGDLFVFGLTGDGTAYAWGGTAINDGQSGLGDTNVRSSPVLVTGSLKFDELFNTSINTYGLEKGTGKLYSWGANSNGELGLGDTTSRSSPVAVTVIGGSRVKKFLAKGGGTVLALMYDGSLYSWGSNSVGQLGIGNQVSKSSPVLVASGVTDVWSLGVTSIIKKTDGLLYGWGYGNYGLHGIGDQVTRSTPTLCAALNSLNFVDIKLGWTQGFGWTADGSVYVWGNNDEGQFGDGTTTNRSSPVLAFGGLKAVEINYRHFSTQDGTLYARGYNNFWGNLGNGSANGYASSPVLVLGQFGVDPSYESKRYSIQVDPSTTYNLKMGWQGNYFGNTPLPNDIEKITIDYPVRGNT